MRIQLLPVLSPIVPIFALQIPEFLLGLHPLGEISCRGLYSVLAPVSSKCRSSAPELKFPFWNSNLLCAIHLSVSCIPDIFPCCRGGLPFFQGFPEPVLLSFESLLMILKMNTFPPCKISRERRKQESILCSKLS